MEQEGAQNRKKKLVISFFCYCSFSGFFLFSLLSIIIKKMKYRKSKIENQKRSTVMVTKKKSSILIIMRGIFLLLYGNNNNNNKEKMNSSRRFRRYRRHTKIILKFDSSTRSFYTSS